MAARADRVFRFKVTLRRVRPPVWRRIVIPADATFWDLHVAIQDAMGWTDSHLHRFRFGRFGARGSVEIGIPDEDLDDDPPTRAGWLVPLTRHLGPRRRRAVYEYDFGDGWEHDVVLEEVRSPEPGERLPACLAGRRACPPEDCGGPSGYAHLLEVLATPGHPEHSERREWAGGSFDPERFNPDDVVFDDPQERWDLAFCDEGSR